MVLGAFEGEEVVFDVILMIRLSFDIQIQNVRHLESGSFKSVALFHKTHENEPVTKVYNLYPKQNTTKRSSLYIEPYLKQPTS